MPAPRAVASQVSLELCGLGSMKQASAARARRCSREGLFVPLGRALEEGGLALAHADAERREAEAPLAPAKLVQE